VELPIGDNSGHLVGEGYDEQPHAGENLFWSWDIYLFPWLAPIKTKNVKFTKKWSFT
jgi:hypothetical protein